MKESELLKATRLGLPIPEKLRDILVQPKVEGSKDGIKQKRISAFTILIDIKEYEMS